MKSEKVSNVKIAQDLYLADWSEQMGQVLRAGLTAEDGIELMLEDESIDLQEREMLEGMLEVLRTRGELSDAMEEAGCYPQEMIHMVKLGERTGHLEKILYSLQGQYQRQYALKKSIRNVVLYPASIALVMMVLIGIILVFVMPVFKQAYGTLGIEMTGLSKTFYDLGEWLGRMGLPLVGVILLVLIALIGRSLYRYRYMGTVPFAKVLEKQDSLSACRFAGVMALCYAGGTTTEEGLEMSMELIESETFKDRIQDCLERTTQGERFYEAVRNSGIFQGRTARRIQMAERTAELDTVMQEIADDLQEEIDHSVDKRMSHIEPILIGILSLVSALILFSVILPLLGIMSTL